MRGFIEAYERLQAAKALPRDEEWFKAREKEQRDAEYRSKVSRLRKSVA